MESRPNKEVTTHVVCPGCGAQGTVEWDLHPMSSAGSRQRKLRTLSAGFRAIEISLHEEPRIECALCRIAALDGAAPAALRPTLLSAASDWRARARAWRAKASELRAAARSLPEARSRSQYLRLADTYETLAQHADLHADTD